MLKSKILTKYSTEIATAPLFEILYIILEVLRCKYGLEGNKCKYVTTRL